MHPAQLCRYTELVSGKRKLPAASDEKPTKQPKLEWAKSTNVSQAKVDELVLNVVTEGLLPFSFVGLPAFKQLVVGSHTVRSCAA